MVTSVRGGRRPGVWKRALIVMLSISLIGALGVPGTAGAATPLPAPTNLVPNGGTFGPTPTLSWSPVPGADHYQVTFPNHQGSVQTTYIWGTSYVPVDDFPPGPVSWSVAAVDRSNNVGAVANATFTNASVNAPTLTCPGSTVNFPAQAPTLTWTPIRGVRNYTLLVSSTPTFVPASTITLTTQATSYTLTKGIPTSTVYYAQVSGATGSGINTGTSATCQFTVVWSQGTTGVNDAIPNYLSPANGASVRNVQLEWSPLKGAARYEVQISPNGDWTNNLHYDIVTDASVWSPAKTLDNGSYYWRVRGIDNEGNFSRWSDYPSTTGSAWQFTVTPLATPAPTAPAANAIVPLPNLLMSWNPSPGAGAYQIELSSTSSFSTSVTCFTTQTDWSPYVVPQMNPPAPQVSGPVVNQPGCVGGANNGALWPVLTSGTIYWHVRALDDLVPNDGPNSALFTSTNQPPRKAYVSTWSAPQLFFTNQTAATLVSPAPSATVAVPTMSWTAVPGAVFYQVSVTSWYWGWNSNTNQCTAPGPGGGSQRSYNTAALSLTPSLVAVPRPSTNPQCPVNVSWTVTPYSFTANAGQLNNYIPGPTPTARTFTWSGYQAGAGSTPNPIGPSPANNATVLATQIPTFSWTPVTGADHYQVWWYANPALSTYVPLQDLNVGNGMNDPVTESFTPVQPLPVGQGAWQIVALDSNNNVISSGPKETLNVASPPNVPANSIQFTSKTMAGTTSTCNSGCQIPATPLITWGAVPGVTNYRVYIAQDPNFTNVVRIYDTATTSLRSVEALPDNQAGQSYYVSVQPVLADWYTGPSSTGAIYGNFGASVDPTGLGAFKKASSAVASPRTVGPAQTGGACNASAVSSISDMPTFCWNAATPYASGDVGAMSYHIQVATTPDFSNIIDQAWVDQPTYTPYVWPANVYGDGGYFPGSWPNGIRDLTYPDGMLYWRVQAIDSTGNPLTYSAVASVTKSSTGITMTGPANGATVPQTTSLSW
ncbi:MAG: hypothetical protein JST73_10995, partial [Actinobacteria bacterium]|nr:hypothetical protein [Actinomycetota bacterium]